MSRFEKVADGVFVWTDTCNVYVLRDGDAAMLIDLGDGSVLDALAGIGVRRVEWVLFTHHHREQCQGAARLAAWRKAGTKVACSTVERPFLERPTDFRKMRPSLSDAHTVYGASYLRPPVAPVAVDRAFAKMDDFEWRGRRFWCIETPGHSPGHMAYMLRDGHRWLGFTGDLMCDGARMQTWFDSEWDYGFAKGIFELAQSAAQVAGYDPEMLLPSHGAVVGNPRGQLAEYIDRLKRLAALYVRGYDIQRFAGCDQDTVSRPSAVPHVWQVSKHLYKFRGPNYWVNFAMILSDSGRALLVDCGLFNRTFLDTAIARMKEHMGLKQIDAVFVTHMHGDHALEADHVRTKWGAKLWTMEGVADKFERPWDHDLSALLPMYTDPTGRPGPLKFDRVLADGAVIEWEGFTFAVDWMPGQTKYHACLHGEIDGKRVAFTGDNICGNSADPAQGGNEAVVARNGGALEEGYIRAASFLHSIGPDLIVGGHCWVIDKPKAIIDRLRKRADDLREAFRSLSTEADYRYMFDPYWVKCHPYRVPLARGATATAGIHTRNYLDRPQDFAIAFRSSAGLTFEPARIEVRVAPESTAVTPLRITAAADAPEGLHIVAMDITHDGKRCGELFDFLVYVGELPK